jgi:Ca2+/H+ antiporter
MRTPRFLWLYLVLAFACLILLTVTIRTNLEFIHKVKAQGQCKSLPKHKTAEIWNYVGVGTLVILLILIFVALAAEIQDLKKLGQ